MVFIIGSKIVSSLKNGFMYAFLGKASYVFVNLIVNAVLSRILTPAQYGIVAVCQVFIIFFQMMVEAGMGPAIIQNKNLSEHDIGVLFNYSVILALIMSTFFGLFGYLLVLFYGNAIYLKLAWIQSIAIFLNGLNVVPTALLNKNKNFRAVNINQIIASVVSGIVGIVLAIKGFGVYSLTWSSVILAMSYFLLDMSAVKINFNFELNKSILMKIWGFSSYQFSFNFINYFTRNGDNILIGKFLGTAALGNYNKAYQLLMMPNNFLLGIVNPVLQPVLSDYQDNITVIRNVYLKIVRLLALVGMSLSVYLNLFGKQIIFFVYGNQWQAAVLPFKFLSTTIWIQLTLSTTGAIFQSRNKSKELYSTGLISSFILIASIVIGILSNNLNLLSLFLTIGFYGNYFICFQRTMRLALDSNLRTLFRELRIPVLTAFIELIFLGIIKQLCLQIKSSFIVIMISGCFFVIIFALMSIITQEYKFIYKIIK